MKSRRTVPSAADATVTVETDIETSNGRRLYLELLLRVELGQNQDHGGAGIRATPKALSAALKGISNATAAKVLAGNWRVPESIRLLADRSAGAIESAAVEGDRRAEAVTLTFAPARAVRAQRAQAG